MVSIQKQHVGVCRDGQFWHFFEKCSFRFVNNEQKSETKRTFSKTIVFERDETNFLKRKNETIVLKSNFFKSSFWKTSVSEMEKHI